VSIQLHSRWPFRSRAAELVGPIESEFFGPSDSSDQNTDDHQEDQDDDPDTDPMEGLRGRLIDPTDRVDQLVRVVHRWSLWRHRPGHIAGHDARLASSVKSPMADCNDKCTHHHIERVGTTADPTRNGDNSRRPAEKREDGASCLLYRLSTTAVARGQEPGSVSSNSVEDAVQLEVRTVTESAEFTSTPGAVQLLPPANDG
jgi:hypothetical protein